MKTIAVKNELHEKIATYGKKNETYNQILERMYEDAIEVQTSKLFLNTEGTVDINDLEW